MAIYKWPVKLNFCYFLLLVYCKAIRHNQECLEMAKMMKDDYICLTPHCDIYESTTTESTLLESNLTESELDNGNWSAEYYRPIDQGYWHSDCKCDEKCVEYDDCCFDAHLASKDWTENKYKKDGHWVCLPLRFRSNGFHGTEYFIYMIGNCPADWSGDETLPDLCQRKATLSDYSHLVDVPVFSNITNITYANLYCALCHSDTAQLAKWDSWIDCNEELGLQDDIFNSSHYERGLRQWTKIVNCTRVTCKFFVEQFQKFDIYLETTGSRHCVPTIKTCAANWTDSAIETKCQNANVLYVEPYRLRERMIFRNPYCATCNYVCHSELLYYMNSLPLSGHIRMEQRSSFAVLLDFNFGGSKQTARCRSDQFYDHLRGQCQAVVCGSMFDNVAGTCVAKNSSQGDNFDWMEHGRLNSSCQRLNLQENQDFIIENGSLILNKTGQIFLPGEYELTADGRNASICSESLERNNSLFKYSQGQSLLSDICLTISVICLALHISINASLPKLRNLPGKNLLSLSCALFIAQLVFLMGIQSASKWTTLAGYGLCAGIGFLIHWSYLAAFFWMNVMGFDICRTFAGSTRHRPTPGSGQDSTFKYYSLYSWGLPTLIVLLGISLDMNHLDNDLKPLYGNHDPECWMDNWAPAYGVGSCWISNPRGLGIFFVIPVAVLLLGNIVMFSITVFSILKQSRAAKFALEKKPSYRKPGEKRPSSVTDRIQPPNQTNLKRQIRFILYIKLALIMGLGWIFGFVAAFADLSGLWYPFIFFNALQGAFIFVAFTCKRKVYYMMYFRIRKEPHPNDTSSSSRTASNNKPSYSKQRISSTTSSNVVAEDFESKRLNSVDIHDHQNSIPGQHQD